MWAGVLFSIYTVDPLAEFDQFSSRSLTSVSAAESEPLLAPFPGPSGWGLKSGRCLFIRRHRWSLWITGRWRPLSQTHSEAHPRTCIRPPRRDRRRKASSRDGDANVQATSLFRRRKPPRGIQWWQLDGVGIAAVEGHLAVVARAGRALVAAPTLTNCSGHRSCASRAGRGCRR